MSNERMTTPPPRSIGWFEIAFGIALVALAVAIVITYSDNLMTAVDGLATFSSSAKVLLAVVAAGTLFALLMPVLESTPDAGAAVAGSTVRGTARQNRALEILYAEKMRVLRAIRDLDFDYDVGKLTDDIYAEQRVHLIRQAIALLRRIDSLESEIMVQQERIAAALAAFRGKK